MPVGEATLTDNDRGRLFACTCKHVVSKLPTGDCFLLLGNNRISCPTSSWRLADKIDLAVLPLSLEMNSSTVAEPVALSKRLSPTIGRVSYLGADRLLFVVDPARSYSGVNAPHNVSATDVVVCGRGEVATACSGAVSDSLTFDPSIADVDLVSVGIHESKNSSTELALGFSASAILKPGFSGAPVILRADSAQHSTLCGMYSGRASNSSDPECVPLAAVASAIQALLKI